jgi:hypothetical protein
MTLSLKIIIIIIIFITILASGIYFLTKHNKSTNNQNNNPPITCPSGEVLDPNGNCVPYIPPTHNCPTGQVWDPNSNSCITPPSHNCPTGQVWDPNSNSCVTPPPTHNCPTGQVWDPNSNSCVLKPCPNGQVRDKNGNCIIACNGHGSLTDNGCECDTYYTGSNCQCDQRNIPSNYIKNPCRGIGDPICNPDGTWSLENAKTCTDIYNNFVNEGGWQTNCYSEICKNADPNYNHVPYCNPGTLELSCQQQCSTKADPTKCADCMPDGKNTNATCICDGSSTPPYNWYCHTNETNSCLSPIPKGLCTDGTDPVCISCGDGIYSWHCPNSGIYNKECMIKDLKLREFDNITPSNPGKTLPATNWFWNTGATSGIENPVFPTINNDMCDSRISSGSTPYSSPIFGSHMVYNSLNSQDGFVTGLKGNLDPTVSNTKLYVHDPKDENLLVYNTIQSNYTCSDGKASVPGVCFDGRGTYPPLANNLCQDGTSATEICMNGGSVTGLNLNNPKFAINDGTYNPSDHSYDGQAFQYHTGCMKFPNQYCNGRGTFKQYCFKQSGDLVDCNDPSAYFMDDGGSCTCDNQPIDVFGNITPYAGSNCQYSDVINCYGRGSVSADENDQPMCKCKAPYINIGSNLNCSFVENFTCYFDFSNITGGNIHAIVSYTNPTIKTSIILPTMPNMPNSGYIMSNGLSPTPPPVKNNWYISFYYTAKRDTKIALQDTSTQSLQLTNATLKATSTPLKAELYTESGSPKDLGFYPSMICMPGGGCDCVDGNIVLYSGGDTPFIFINYF